ncbi:MAG: hypothetical protein WAO58_03710 [Fimbriimonadaceae bacterium]
MGEVDRIHRIVQPSAVPGATHQVAAADDRKDRRRNLPEDKLELHVVEAQPEEPPEVSDEPDEGLDLAV